MSRIVDHIAGVLSSGYGGQWVRFMQDGELHYMSDARDVVKIIESDSTSMRLIVIQARDYTRNAMPVGVPFRMVF